MATFKICVFEHQKREDGRYRVSVRVTQRRNSAYLRTDVYVVRGQISSDFKSLRDTTTQRAIDRDIEGYEKMLLREYGSDLSAYSAKDIVSIIAKHNATKGGANIDFVAFTRKHIYNIKSPKNGYADTLETALRALIDFFGGREIIYIREINYQCLVQFEKFLRKNRTIRPINQFGREVITKNDGISDNTIVEYMTKLRVLFNACKDHYNGDEDDQQLIPHNPFKKYKMPALKETKKRNLSVEGIQSIYNSPGVESKRDLLPGRKRWTKGTR